MNHLDPPKKKVSLEEVQSHNVITILLVFACLGLYCCYARNTYWFEQYSVQSVNLLKLVQSSDYKNLLATILTANLASLTWWQAAGNAYFIWIFGSTVEKRFSTGRFIVLLFLGALLPWAIQIWDGFNTTWLSIPGEAGGATKALVHFCGPSMLSFTILGAYMVLVPERKVLKQSYMPRPRGEIFKNPQPQSLVEHYGLTPRTFISMFLIYQVGLHFAMIKFEQGYDTVGIISAGAATLIGYLTATILVQDAAHSFKDGPLKLEALKHYHELISLDVGHEEAVRGVAKTMAMPTEQIRTWVAQNKGKMRIS